MEILTSIAALITAAFFFEMLYHLVKYRVDKKRKKEALPEKKKAKKSGILFVICYIATILIGVAQGDTGNAYRTVSTEEQTENPAELSVSEDEAMEKDITQEKEKAKEEDQTEEESQTKEDKNQKNTEDYGEDYSEDYEEDYDFSEPEIDPDIAEEWEEEEYTIEEMEEKALTYTTLLTYTYDSTKHGKKVKTLIEDNKDASEKDFCYILEKSKLFSSKKTYEMTIDSSAEYMYYGDLKKDKPDGYGILYYEHFPVYIGEFSKGVKDGYGIDIIESDFYQAYLISYEGEFKDGLREGDGVEHRGFVEGSVLDSYYYALGMYKREALKCLDLSYDVPLIDSVQIYKGEFQDGEYDGDGVSYYGSGQIMYEGEFENGVYDGDGVLYFGDGQLQYEGKFKNGAYNGKGTLYSEDGDVIYKGEFKNGDIK